MNIKRVLFLGFSLLIVLALAACQPGTKATTAPEATVTSSAPTSGEATVAYPAPATGEQNAPSQTQPATNPYPEPAQDSTVNWDQAQNLIMNGDVTQVTQAKSLEVTITFKDGVTIKTTEPAFGDVEYVIKSCGDKCKDIKVVNE